MHGLDNKQIILLTLLVSFVTSIATGIVTVTLLEQVPKGVTQTINRVVEKTVETIIPETKTVVREVPTESTESKITSVVEKRSPTLVTILIKQETINSDGETNVQTTEKSGFFVSSDGYIITSAPLLTRGLVYIINYGQDISAQAALVNFDQERNIAILKIVKDNVVAQSTLETIAKAVIGADKTAYIPLTDTTPILGQTVIALGRPLQGTIVRSGLLSLIQTATSSPATLEIDIPEVRRIVGGPLLSLTGNLLGVVIESKSSGTIAVPTRVIISLVNQEKIVLETGKSDQTASTGSAH